MIFKEIFSLKFTSDKKHWSVDFYFSAFFLMIVDSFIKTIMSIKRLDKPSVKIRDPAKQA